MATTSVAIYRIGIDKANLLQVRSQDVSIYQDPGEAEICVQPQGPASTPGISCWTTQHAAANAAAQMASRAAGAVARVWELPANSAFDDTRLRLWQPRAEKWYWSPVRNMRGSEFVDA